MEQLERLKHRRAQGKGCQGLQRATCTFQRYCCLPWRWWPPQDLGSEMWGQQVVRGGWLADLPPPKNFLVAAVVARWVPQQLVRRLLLSRGEAPTPIHEPAMAHSVAIPAHRHERRGPGEAIPPPPPTHPPIPTFPKELIGGDGLHLVGPPLSCWWETGNLSDHGAWGVAVQARGGGIGDGSHNWW